MQGSGGPRIEMVSNPDFSFPTRPRSVAQGRTQTDGESSRRPISDSAAIRIDIPTPQNHGRSASTLPNFNFNAEDTSGRQNSVTPPRTPDSLEENAAITPSRRGHRRGGSEFVGGDSRLGLTNVVSSSPTKNNPLSSFGSGPPPVIGRRGHAHRRSAAISSHDIGSLMQAPSEVQPRLSSSLPTTPSDTPSEAKDYTQSSSLHKPDLHGADSFGPPLETVERLQSRPRVGFVMQPEIIPRPLSTISSGTESSVSTVLGHSVNNSLTSMLSLGTPSPPPRTSTISLSKAMEEEPRSRAKTSLDISKRVEKEGEWLKRRPSEGLDRPMSDSVMGTPTTTFAETIPVKQSGATHKKRPSHSQTPGFDRRKSEPSIGLHAHQAPRSSVVSLQETISNPVGNVDDRDPHNPEHKSSARKIKEWAAIKVLRRPKEAQRTLTTASSTSSIRPSSAGSISVPGKVARHEFPEAETDLDAVLGAEDNTSEVRRPATPRGFDGPTFIQQSSSRLLDGGEYSPVLDLDAALGPFNTPPMGGIRPRKELHSSRLPKDFGGPGGHYHRRSESEPALAPFQHENTSTASQQEMADVFEEDEEDDIEDSPLQQQSAASPTPALKNQVVAARTLGSGPNKDDLEGSSSSSQGLDIQESLVPEQPTTPSHDPCSRNQVTEALGSSNVGGSTAESSGTQEHVKIVEADEEPRTYSLTKSSDSSETPTITFHPPHTGIVIHRRRPSETPDTMHTPTFPPLDTNREHALSEGSRFASSGSSLGDVRTVSSSTTGEHRFDYRPSVDDVPSLISSRSSVTHAQYPRHENTTHESLPSAVIRPTDPVAFAERRRKRSSIQSLSQLVGGSFNSKPKGAESSRPQTALMPSAAVAPKKDHRLKKLMFWRSKQQE